VILVLLGAPGAGKGTQADVLVGRLGLLHLSTGELLREHLRRRTPLGLEAEGYMSRGELVPDETVIGMVADRLGQPDAAGGIVLDGFPRTVAQAEALDRLLGARGWPPTHAVLLDVPREALVRRLTGRRVCRAAGHTYNMTHKPPRVEGVCDLDGSALVQRPDDAPETVVRRLDVYFDETGPVVEYFRSRERLTAMSGEGAPDTVAERLSGVLGAAAG